VATSLSSSKRVGKNEDFQSVRSGAKPHHTTPHDSAAHHQPSTSDNASHGWVKEAQASIRQQESQEKEKTETSSPPLSTKGKRAVQVWVNGAQANNPRQLSSQQEESERGWRWVLASLRSSHPLCGTKHRMSISWHPKVWSTPRMQATLGSLSKSVSSSFFPGILCPINGQLSLCP